MDGGLTWRELLERVPLHGKRPDATLKRLRRAGLLPKPTPKSLGRGRGMAQVYPAWAEERLRSITALRSQGVRAGRELLWWLWYGGGDDLWPAVQRNLLVSYPRSEQKTLELMQAGDPEASADAIGDEAPVLARDWSNPRKPGYDRQAVTHRVEAETLAHVAIGAAVADEEPYLPGPLDDTESGETVGDLVDRAWGQGSASVLDTAIDTGAVDPTRWEAALRCATVKDARVAATMIGRVFSPQQLTVEMLRFGAPWVNRAMLVAATLHALALDRGSSKQ